LWWRWGESKFYFIVIYIRVFIYLIYKRVPKRVPKKQYVYTKFNRFVLKTAQQSTGYKYVLIDALDLELVALGQL
jgi:hypothetical protein